jgi:HD-GYP domain-containing protein (c-di-GMP phosphodiesterase class II)/DNA-binding CsgD family transcriptional regulator
MSDRSMTPATSVRLAPILQTFAIAADHAFGLELEDGLRTCYVVMRIAEELGLSEHDRRTVYYTSLLKDAGCTSPSPALAGLWQADEIAFRRDVVFPGMNSFVRRYIQVTGRSAGGELPLLERIGAVLRVLARGEGPFVEIMGDVSEVCARISQRLGLPPSVHQAALALNEQWDGKGMPRKLRGAEIPLAARVIMPGFFVPPLNRMSGRRETARAVRQARARLFQPEVADAFLSLAAHDEFWEQLESDSISEAVLRMEPGEPIYLGPGGEEDAALALADFIDLKAPFAAAHSRRVANYARTIAEAAGSPGEEVRRISLAALVHDLGLVGVPTHTLNKPAKSLTASEREALRLHPYHGERILVRAPLSPGIEPLVGAHHEHVDGSGYYRGLKGEDIPFGARVIAVAARLDELTHEAPGAPACSLAEALGILRGEAGRTLDQKVVGALLRQDAEPPNAKPHRAWPAGLTDREVEVLRLACTGQTRRDIAERLGITENTVRHHLEHIYNKTGTSTRVGATLFAMENDLLA